MHLALKLSSVFRAVCSLCSHISVLFFRSDLLLLVEVLVSFAWFALRSQIPESLSLGLLFALKF